MQGVAQVLIDFEGTSEQVDELVKAIDTVFLNNGIHGTVNGRVSIKEEHGMAPAPVDPTPPPAPTEGEKPAEDPQPTGDPQEPEQPEGEGDDGNDDVA